MQKFRSCPRLPHDKDAEPASSTIMHWSRAPVWGTIPMRTMRAHTVTLVDTTAWLFGGCDDKDSSKDIYCFDTETMQWTHPDTVGEQPPPCRAHTSTLYDRKLLIYGGGLASVYYDAVYVLDTTTRRWTKPKIAPGPRPAARRAHSAVHYKGKVWIFGGGTGLTALNDVWTLDVSGGAGTSTRPMVWEEVVTEGKKPGPRGYHTANLVGNMMVVIGGSDGKESFTDVWCLNLDTLGWNLVKQQQPFYKRLAHTATQVGSFIFIMGGHNATEYVSELLTYNLVSLQYEPRLVIGKPPSMRGYHATILADSRLFVFGGFNGQTAFDDVYILDLAAGAYLPQVTSFTMDPL
ncbi:galactose oxidase [Pholiota conissans]|uniref:Galactose oxidase n=1 Tax=Pholiota conissans TaxID=109636 RepID=A0A9P5Z363_9AGAR|nr:galactose oxidase [Pholiota conissans]